MTHGNDIFTKNLLTIFRGNFGLATNIIYMLIIVTITQISINKLCSPLLTLQWCECIIFQHFAVSRVCNVLLDISICWVCPNVYILWGLKFLNTGYLLGSCRILYDSNIAAFCRFTSALLCRILPFRECVILPNFAVSRVRYFAKFCRFANA